MTGGLTLKTWSAGTPKRIHLTLGCKPKGPIASTIGGVRAAVYTLPPSCASERVGLDDVVARAGYGYDIRENSQPPNKPNIATLSRKSSEHSRSPDAYPLGGHSRTLKNEPALT
jgi:hypothetical protein